MREHPFLRPLKTFSVYLAISVLLGFERVTPVQTYIGSTQSYSGQRSQGCTMNCFPFGYSQLIDTCPILRTLTPCFTQPTQSSPFLNPLLAFTAVLQGPNLLGAMFPKPLLLTGGRPQSFGKLLDGWNAFNSTLLRSASFLNHP